MPDQLPEAEDTAEKLEEAEQEFEKEKEEKEGEGGLEGYTPSQPGDPDQAAGRAARRGAAIRAVGRTYRPRRNTPSSKLHGKADKAIATAPWRTAAKRKKIQKLDRQGQMPERSGFRLRSRGSRHYRSLKDHIRLQSKKGGVSRVTQELKDKVKEFGRQQPQSEIKEGREEQKEWHKVGRAAKRDREASLDLPLMNLPSRKTIVKVHCKRQSLFLSLLRLRVFASVFVFGRVESF